MAHSATVNVNGVLMDVQELDHSAAQVDSAISRALPGGELDAGYNYIVNAWFSSLYRINQHGVSGTISTAGYFLDMWELVSGSVTLTTTGITLNGTIRQKRENSIGLTCTASVRMISGTATASYDDGTKIFTIVSSGGEIECAKLEVGVISTLPYDTPPTPAEQELNRQACMRCLQTGYMNAIAFNSTILIGLGNYFTKMRLSPTVSISSWIGTVSKVSLWASLAVDVGANATITVGSAEGILAIEDSTAPFTAGTYYVFRYSASAEL